MSQQRPFLDGDKVYLRGLSREDLEGPWLDWFNDQENTQYMSHGTYPSSREGHTQFYQNVVLSRDNLVLAICLKANGRHVGNIGLHGINWLFRSAQLGIVIGERSVQGQGIGTEAAKIIVAHGFNRLNLHKIWLRTAEQNVVAKRAFEKAGFKAEGLLREEICRNGEWQNAVYMGLLESEFRSAA